MSDLIKNYVTKVWELTDEILNALLFSYGIEMIIFSFDQRTLWIGLFSIVVVLSAMFIAIFFSTLLLSFRRSMKINLILLLTWGGLRSAISVALALSLPQSEYRDIIISVTYIIVIFSILCRE